MVDSVTKHNQLTLGRLRRQWGMIVAIWVGAAILFWGVGWVPRNGRSLPLIFLSFTFCLATLFQNLSKNHREGDNKLLPTFGLGNHLTLSRGLAISLMASYIFAPQPDGWLAWMPMFLYTFAGIADYFDGYLARQQNHATPLGSILDIEFDGWGMLVVCTIGVWWGMVPWWYLLLGIARPWFIFGMWWREQRGKPNYEMLPSQHRRIVAGFQMGFMSAILWPIIPPELTNISGTIIGLATSISFLRDWWMVSGRLNPTNNGVFFKLWRKLYHLLTQQLPPIWRALLLFSVVMIHVGLPDIVAPTPWQSLMASWGMRGTAVYATILTLIAFVGTTSIFVGAMGRVWGVLLIFPIGFDIATAGLTIWNGSAITAVSFLILFGTGAFSLWQPEERFISTRLG